MRVETEINISKLSELRFILMHVMGPYIRIYIHLGVVLQRTIVHVACTKSETEVVRAKELMQ